MTTRTYLSIGDVLTLLREEFPDVTISKIRFLESQGLVNPERSPSGYRKFFDHDVERLRWVLRQQREHFLPLKVIRDRLADGELDDPGTDVGNGKPSEPAYAAAGARPAVQAQAHAHAQAQEQPTKADQEAMARILEDASRRAAKLPEDVQARRGLQVVAEGETAVPAAMEHGREAAAPAGPTARAPAGETRASGAPRLRRDACLRRSSRLRREGDRTRQRDGPPAAAGTGCSDNADRTTSRGGEDTQEPVPGRRRRAGGRRAGPARPAW